MDWQRHYAYLTQLLAEGARLSAIKPGMTRHDEVIGRWLDTQRRDWNRLNDEQQTRLGDLLTSPPEHTRLRRLVAGQFTARRMKLLAGRIQAIVDEPLDALAAAPQPADLMKAVALPVPSLVISELLGVPFTDRDQYQRLTAELLSLDRTREQLLAAKAEMKTYLLHLIGLRRPAPGDDLISGLLQAQDTDPALSDDEIAALAQLILIAGHETTANVIGLATLLMLRPPRLWDTVCRQPELVDGVVEETLRYATVLHSGSCASPANL
ncbi:cytochrome P450 [Streptomyces sp. NPDC006670]|uniref:cytochrome P450 n=1 Tax=Streptomyces sp. NPDC006670 TaxID=3154476 RepID=UPI0033DE10BE